VKIKKTPTAITASNPKGKKDVASKSKSAVQAVTKTKNIKTSQTDFSTRPTTTKDITPCSTCLVKFCDDLQEGHGFSVSIQTVKSVTIAHVKVLRKRGRQCFLY